MTPGPEELRPPLPAPLEVGQAFPGGWSVAGLSPLALEQRVPPELVRRTVVPLGPLVLAWVAFAASWDSAPSIKLAVWPVAVALLGTAVLGVLNLFRSVRRRLDGVRLTVDETTVTGYPEARSWLGDYFVRVGDHPRAAVVGVCLSVFRDPRSGLARARVRVELSGGAALVGPEASGDDAQWPQVRDALLPAAAALARALGRKLELDYPWAGQRLEAGW